jgi:hypothetical protein
MATVSIDETKCLLSKDLERGVGDGLRSQSSPPVVAAQPITSRLSSGNDLNPYSSSLSTSVRGREGSTKGGAMPLSKMSQFQAQDLENGNDTGLLSKFNFLLSIGMEVYLHTTKGPKPIIITLVGTEIRWQAASKNASKRFKLKLIDVMSIQLGKQTGNFVAFPDPTLQENLCFSLVTQKTTLDLQVKTKVDRDSLVRGFQLQLDAARNSSII